MCPAAALLLAALSTAPVHSRPASPAVRCVAACSRNVPAALHARICSAGCAQVFARPELAEGWVDRLAAVSPFPAGALASALKDEDWRVRGAALRLEARRAGLTESALWAAHVREGALLWSLTAVRAASARGVPLQTLVGDAQALARLRSFTPSVRAALEVELYAIDAPDRLLALRDLAAFAREDEAAVALQAMRSRPPATDEVLAQTLIQWAARSEVSAPGAVMRAAREGDGPRVNRLFAIWSSALDRLRPQLRSADAALRLEAVKAAAPYAPLCTPELEPLLEVEDAPLRAAVAFGVARGEGRSVLEAALVRLQEGQGSEGVRAGWLIAAGEAQGASCRQRLTALASRPLPSPVLQGAALRGLSACAGAAALPLLAAAGGRAPPVRAAAVLALISIPRSPAAEALALKALADSDAQVVIAAAQVVRAQRQSGAAPALVELLRHPDSAVRRAATEALEVVGGANAAAAVGARLTGDESVDVRVAAARALGAMGGPEAAAALTRAMARETDSHVRYRVQQSLRQLGFNP